jgi:hypothetical protein
MSITDDIDFVLTLNPHGWSTCWFFIGNEKYELAISHVFGDPYVDFMNALKKLMKGNDNVTFFWYGEPGGEKIDIIRIPNRRDKVHLAIAGFSESYGAEIKDFSKRAEFEMKFESLLIVAYFQLKKTFLLMKDRSYAKDRQNDFPFNEFALFERVVKEFLNID